MRKLKRMRVSNRQTKTTYENLMKGARRGKLEKTRYSNSAIAIDSVCVVNANMH